MAAAANNPKFAKKAGIKSGVAKEFHNADKRQKYAGGGLAGAQKARLAPQVMGNRLLRLTEPEHVWNCLLSWYPSHWVQL